MAYLVTFCLASPGLPVCWCTWWHLFKAATCSWACGPGWKKSPAPRHFREVSNKGTTNSEPGKLGKAGIMTWCEHHLGSISTNGPQLESWQLQKESPQTLVDFLQNRRLWELPTDFETTALVVLMSFFEPACHGPMTVLGSLGPLGRGGSMGEGLSAPCRQYPRSSHGPLERPGRQQDGLNESATGKSIDIYSLQISIDLSTDIYSLQIFIDIYRYLQSTDI